MQTKKVNEIITQKIIDELKKGNLRWLKDWSLGFGCNYITRKEYQGINALLINLSLSINNYKFNEWLTFKQIQNLKGSLKAGSKATQIIYFKLNTYCSCKQKDCKLSGEQHKKHSIPILRYYNVFNIQDTNLPTKTQQKVNMPILEVEDKLSKYWNLNELIYGNPAYMPVMDKIRMPNKNDFNSILNFYSALTHELIHSTGHKDRLNRIGVTDISTEDKKQYAFEELIAELGSAFLCAVLNIEKDITNTSAYIESWLKCLESDNNFIFKASKEAQKSQQYILSFSDGMKQQESEVIVEVTA